MSRSAAQIRREFVDFFREKLHTHIPSSPVVPYDDPTLLFTNAGMNQFKPIFLGQLPAGHAFSGLKRAANSQKCIRAGGKHNDLDDVGHDTYHHTFFEMLGNWSFGDYFKRESIEWAWELLTKRWGIDASRLHATYFGGLKRADGTWELEPDHEARELWKQITGMPDSHVHPGNMKDNFWEMGDTGPCGPCSEIHIDLTPDKSGGNLVNAGDARVMEIWNLVFIQFNRRPDGKLDPLPARHVDTGMGFERVTAVIQGKRSNYDTDVFTPIFEAIQQVSGAAGYGGRLATAGRKEGATQGSEREALMRDVAYRVIADHIRTLTFALTDGATPDKEGRGYVLRRILRRAVRYGWQYLNLHEPFLFKLVPTVVSHFGEAFPELKAAQPRVVELIREEEQAFGRTLDRGIALFNEAVDNAAHAGHREISGADAFKLHDTYGFPIDLTQIMASERGLQVDVGEYERLMEEARDKARAGGKKGAGGLAALPGDLLAPFGPTDDSPKFAGETLTGAKVRAIALLDASGGVVIRSDKSTPITPGTAAALVLDKTCFYAEQGGQVGDHGVIGDGSLRFDVEETRRYGDVVVHVGTLVMGEIRVGDSLALKVDSRRVQTKSNHTGTHLLNWALREVLGEGVQQKGSLVDPDKLRFDFSHNKPLSDEELEKIEVATIKQIIASQAVYTKEVALADGMKFNGIRAVFGEKYPDRVRVVSVGAPIDDMLKNPADARWRQNSIEFCGGTHVANTSDIGGFAITVEEGVAKGVRRIVAITGDSAQMMREIGKSFVQQAEELLTKSRDAGPPSDLAESVSTLLGGLQSADVPLREHSQTMVAITALQEIVKQQRKVAAAGSAEVVKAEVERLLPTAEKVGGVTVLVAELPDAPIDQLKHGADIAKQKSGSAALFFGSRSADKVTLLAAMSDDLVKRGVKAGDLVKAIAPLVGGGGGGAPTMAQAGGKDPAKLPEALAAAREWLLGKLR
ncbi:MAG: alanine--tRNA ligase [Phycisphaerae bacterium]|nr:alanine--tRNA ligase [Phycisphaerae bacterium]